MKYFVYYGTVNCDNYDCYPTHIIKEFSTSEEVEAFYKEFQEGIRDDDDQIIFRVFGGNELHLSAVETVTEYRLNVKGKELL